VGVRTLYRLVCDTDDCGAVGEIQLSPTRAMQAGWDTGWAPCGDGQWLCPPCLKAEER